MPTPRQIEEAIVDAENIASGTESISDPKLEPLSVDDEPPVEPPPEVKQPPAMEDSNLALDEPPPKEPLEEPSSLIEKDITEDDSNKSIEDSKKDMDNTVQFGTTNVDIPEPDPEPEPEPPSVIEMDLRPILESIQLGSGLITATTGLKVGLDLSGSDVSLSLSNKVLATNETTAESIRRNLRNLTISEIEEYQTTVPSALNENPTIAKWTENEKLWKSFKTSLDIIEDIDPEKMDALVEEKKKSKDQPTEEAINILEQLGEKGEAVCACLWAPFPKPAVNLVLPLTAADNLWKGVIGEQMNAIKETSKSIPSSLAASLVSEGSDGHELKDALHGIVEASTLCTAPHQGFLLYPTGDGYVNARTSTFVGNRKDAYLKRQEQTKMLNIASSEVRKDYLNRKTERVEEALLNATSGKPLFESGDAYSNDLTFRGTREDVTSQFEDRVDILNKASIETRKDIADRKGGAHKATIHGARYEADIAALTKQELISIYPPPPPPPPVPPKKLGLMKESNGEIIKLHLGQRGCSLGARLVLEQASFHKETGIADPTFWLQGKQGDDCGHRSVFIDSELDTMTNLFGPRSIAKTLFDTSQVVTIDGFKPGSFILDKKQELSEAVKNSIRIQMELCDSFQGFVVTRCLGDAGGALGDMLFNDDGGYLQKECPKSTCLSFDLVDGLHALPSSGVVSMMNEASALSDIGLMKNDRFLSSIIATEALYQHPGRVDGDDPENSLAAKAIAGLLASCSTMTTIGKPQSLEALISTATNSRSGTRLAALSYLPRGDTKIWSSKVAWGQGLISPWGLTEIEAKGANYGNFTSLGTIPGVTLPDFPQSNATYAINVGADFVAALGCNAVAKKSQYSKWLKACEKRARVVFSRRGFCHNYPKDNEAESERCRLLGFKHLLEITSTTDDQPAEPPAVSTAAEEQ